jgi:hypothetical protein
MITKYEDCFEPSYNGFMRDMGLPPYPNRKQWEYWKIAKILQEHCFYKGKMSGFDDDGHKGSGLKGVGFGLGQEDLPEYFVKLGHELLCTDGPLTEQAQREWAETGQHAQGIEALYHNRSVKSLDVFKKRASFRVVDMNHIPDDIQNFDFCWSTGSLEHLGSLAHGFAFINNTLACLKPGGWSVHSTEFNLGSLRGDDYTVESGSYCFYRRRDLERFKEFMESEGHFVLPFDFTEGEHPENRLPDHHPYPRSTTHLSLISAGCHVTSVVIAVQKAVS